MSNRRKTIAVDSVKSIINGMLANSDDRLVEGRTALAGALESVLMSTNNYRGFRYLQQDDKNPSSYGDETRREYY